MAIAVILIHFLCLWLQVAKTRTLPPRYDVVWKSQASPVNGSSSSMPLGGHDLGLNVWAENGTVLFYIAKAGCFDENNSLLKLGRIRLHLNPNPFALDQPFEQKLLLEDGYITISGGNNSRVTLWVDMFDPVIHAEINTSVPTSMTASFDMWRNEDHVMASAEQAQSSWNGIPGIDPITYKDNIQFWDNESILSSHRNLNTSLIDATLAQQQISDHKEDIYDPITNNTFGIFMRGPGLISAGTSKGVYANTSYTAWNLQSERPVMHHSLTIATHQNQTYSHTDWQSQLLSVAKFAGESSHEATKAWWNRFWDRSHIFVNNDADNSNPSFQVGRNYQLFRYMLGCNAFAKWPTKFNGALFTLDPGFVTQKYPYSPDFRRWGGGTFTAQNQRLVYWPLLKSGDADLMVPQFDFYKNIVSTSTMRGRVYYNIDHSWLTEQIDNSGLPQIYNFNSNEFIYHGKRPLSFNPGLEFDAWIMWLSDTAVGDHSGERMAFFFFHSRD